MIARRVRYEIVSRAIGPMLMAMERWRSRGRGAGRSEAPFGPPLEATRKLKELTTLHYLAGRFADGAVPVAWVTYSRDLCGYARADLGCVATGKTPVGRLPRPDLLCCCTNICQTVLYWYRALASHFRVPLVVIDTPFVYGEAQPHLLAYVADQLRELTGTAERVAGRKVDRGELVETMRLAREATGLWDECLRAGCARPSPWTGFDAFFHLAPIVAMRGTRECNAYYRLLRDELDDRVARGVGGVSDERVRLLWDNLPIWFNLRDLSTVLAGNGFNIVCATYTNAWAEAGSMIDPADPEGS
ncbi:MAG: hgdA, partial [Deltaproteobacteria bacterium]|nr:hgdA [Deltaproteobacteria bacterium]